MLAIRIRQYRKARIVYPARVLASATYMTVMCYVIVLNMLSTGAGLHNLQMCKVAIYTCLVFYGTVKGLLLYFMAERVRTVRSMDIPRRQDKVWMSCIVVITMGLSGVIVAALCRANYAYGDTGVCKVGIPNGQTVAVFLFDWVGNTWLTGAFLCKSMNSPRNTGRSQLTDVQICSVLSSKNMPNYKELIRCRQSCAFCLASRVPPPRASKVIERHSLGAIASTALVRLFRRSN